MSEIANKTILELTPLTLYLENDAIPVLRPNLHEDNCITLGNIIWFNTNTKQLVINGRYRFDMSSLIQANLSIKLLGDSGITNFIYNGEPYDKEDSIESEDSFDATITANVDSHYTFNKWQFNGLDISTFHTPDYPNVLNYTFTTGGELSVSTTPRQYTITVNTATPSLGTVSGGGNYNYGLSCTITATASSGFKFVRWTKNGNQVSTNSSYSFTVTENATYTAVFEVEGPPDYYVGLYSNSTDFTSATDSNIINKAGIGLYISVTPKYPSASTFKMLTADEKLIFMLIKQGISTNSIKVDVENPGVIGDLTDEPFTSWFTKNTTRTLTIEGTIYDIYSRYRSSYGEDNGFRIKFN